jgi:hypothetical protein
VGVSVQEAAATVPVHCAVPSLTVTLPVGVPPLDVTAYVTETAWPTTDGSGECPVITVVVLAAPSAIELEVAAVTPVAPKLSEYVPVGPLIVSPV